MKENVYKEPYKEFNKKMRELGFVKEGKYAFSALLKNDVVVALDLQLLDHYIDCYKILRATCRIEIPWLSELDSKIIWSNSLGKLEEKKDMYHNTGRMKYSSVTEFKEVLETTYSIVKSKVKDVLDNMDGIEIFKELLSRANREYAICKNYQNIILSLYFKDKVNAVRIYDKAVSSITYDLSKIDKDDLEYVEKYSNYSSLSELIELSEEELVEKFRERTIKWLQEYYPRLYKKMGDA